MNDRFANFLILIFSDPQLLIRKQYHISTRCRKKQREERGLLDGKYQEKQGSNLLTKNYEFFPPNSQVRLPERDFDQSQTSRDRKERRTNFNLHTRSQSLQFIL